MTVRLGFAMMVCVYWSVKAPTIVHGFRTVEEDCVQTAALVQVPVSGVGFASMAFVPLLNVKKIQIARRIFCADDSFVYPQTHVNQMKSATLANVV